MDQEIKNKPYKRMYPNIKFDQDGVWEIDKNDNWHKVSSPMGIASIQENIDTRKIKFLLWFEYMQKRKELLIDRSHVLLPRKFVELQDQGVDVLQSTAGTLVHFMREQEQNAEHMLVHSTLGFGSYEKNLIFKHYKSIPLGSIYEGSYQITPRGSKDVWLQMVREQVLGTPLELALVMGFSASVVAFIGQDIGVQALIGHLMGQSTTGKSTALKLAVSPYSYPELNKEGLFVSFNGTDNALSKQLAGLQGIPLALDELAASNLNNFTKLIHRFSQGIDKRRADKELNLRQQETWSTTILTNGERSLIENASKDAGIQARVYEFDNIQWTRSSANAQTINKVIINNYGHFALPFAEELMKQGKEEILKLYNKKVDKLLDIFAKRHVKDNFTERRIKGYAIFLATAAILEKVTEIQFNKSKMVDMFLKVEKESLKARNFELSVLEYLKQYVKINKVNFTWVGFKENPKATSKCFGTIIKTDEGVKVEFIPLALDAILKEGGYENKKVVLKELKKHRHLECEPDRHYQRKGDNREQINTVTFYKTQTK